MKNPSATDRKKAKEIALITNDFSFNAEGIAQAMLDEHRTLQQSFTRLCSAWLIALATAPEWCVDGRNEASYELAKKCKEICENSPLPFI